MESVVSSHSVTVTCLMETSPPFVTTRELSGVLNRMAVSPTVTQTVAVGWIQQQQQYHQQQHQQQQQQQHLYPMSCYILGLVTSTTRCR